MHTSLAIVGLLALATAQPTEEPAAIYNEEEVDAPEWHDDLHEKIAGWAGEACTHILLHRSMKKPGDPCSSFIAEHGDETSKLHKYGKEMMGMRAKALGSEKSKDHGAAELCAEVAHIMESQIDDKELGHMTEKYSSDKVSAEDYFRTHCTDGFSVDSEGHGYLSYLKHYFILGERAKKEEL